MVVMLEDTSTGDRKPLAGGVTTRTGPTTAHGGKRPDDWCVKLLFELGAGVLDLSQVARLAGSRAGCGAGPTSQSGPSPSAAKMPPVKR